MSRDWKFVKLKDVCQVVTGSTPKTNIPEYWDGEYPWVTPAELKGEKYIQDTERHITDEAVAHTNLTLMPVGTVLLSSRAPIGKVAITETEMYCNQGFKNLICSDKIDNQYLYLWLSSQTEYLNSLGRGATFKEISKTIVENIEVPLTSIEKQHKIVAELNKIKELLGLKCKQLEIYDKLAQSLFYEMFGDPVENEKGWEVKKLGDIGEIITGSTPSMKDESNYSSNDYCFVKPSDLPDKGIEYLSTSESFMSEKGFSNSRCLVPGSVLVSCIGSIGKIGILKVKAASNQQINAITPFDFVDSVYLAYVIYGVKDYMVHIANAPVVPIINKTTFSKFQIPIPPLSLQQDFATRIEAIEKQKASVKAAIEKLETLLNSRMDYWFVIQPVAEEIVENYLSES